MSAAVDALCEQLEPLVGPGPAAGLRGLRHRLAGPVQLIVAGRVSAGKSTLVNALIGRRVAETAAPETTRVPAVYRYGPVDRIREIDGRLDVTVPAAALRDLTVIDTPGLGSVQRADPVLAGSGEAMLYVLNQTVRSDDAELLSAFQAAGRGQHPGPCATIAVLSKADMVTGSATDLAERAAAVLGPRVCGVLPMVGLFAESAATGRFDNADVAALRQLSGCADLALLTSSADEFLERPVPVAGPVRRRLLDRLGLAGVRQLAEALAADPALSVADLRRSLLHQSGLPELRRRIDRLVLDRADPVKAGAALAAVGAMCGRLPAARDATEALLARSASHRLRLLDALNQVCSGMVELPPELTAELTALATDGTDLDPAHALDRARWWRAFAGFGATPDQARVAEVVHRAYFLRWRSS